MDSKEKKIKITDCEQLKNVLKEYNPDLDDIAFKRGGYLYALKKFEENSWTPWQLFFPDGTTFATDEEIDQNSLFLKFALDESEFLIE